MPTEAQVNESPLRPVKTTGRHIHVLLPLKEFDELNELIPWGNKQRVMQTLIRGLIRLLRTPKGSMYLGLFLKEEISFEDLIIMAAEKKDE